MNYLCVDEKSADGKKDFGPLEQTACNLEWN